jgi:hypothetical protein
VALLDERLKDKLEKIHKIVLSYCRSYAAIWKQILGSEKRDTEELHAAETPLVRSLKECSRLDKIRYEDVRKGTGVFSANDRIRRYRQGRLEHAERTEEGRVPKQA